MNGVRVAVTEVKLMILELNGTGYYCFIYAKKPLNDVHMLFFA